MPLIVAITGASGSGKTTLAKKIKNELTGSLRVSIISMDNYYRNQDHLSMAEREKTNYDHPDAFDQQRLVDDLKKIKQGLPIQVPVYDFSIHSRASDSTRLAPVDICIVEGILPIYSKPLTRCYDYTYYLDVPLETCLDRRRTRDIDERGRTAECIQRQFDTTVIPGFKHYIQKQKDTADEQLTGNEKASDIARRLAELAR